MADSPARKRKRQQRRQRCRQRGLCVNDSKPALPGYTRCAECLELHNREARRLYAERRDSRRCKRCGGERFSADPRFRVGIGCGCCARCYFSAVARVHFRGNRLGEALQELFVSQGGRCALTGEVLILGENTSLDHRVPQSGGGTRTLDNVQWVVKSANFGKGAQLPEEYLATCHRVVAFCASGDYLKIQRSLKRCARRLQDGS